MNFRVSSLSRVDDLLCALIKDRVIVRFHTNTNYLVNRPSHQFKLHIECPRESAQIHRFPKNQPRGKHVKLWPADAIVNRK